jgi:SET domain-containing protein 6
VIKEDRVCMEEDWEESIAPLSLQQPDYFPVNWFTLNHYLAAKTLVASRAFGVDDYHGLGMVPLADL